jgi:hypothetical protein
MNIDINARVALDSAMQDGAERRKVTRATLRRIARFARPQRRSLCTLLLLLNAAAVLAVASLVPRLYDADSGAVRLAGADVRDLSFDSIRDTVGMVTQDGHLFHDTIGANLRLARPEATDEDLWDALRRAHLADLVRSLPDQFGDRRRRTGLPPVRRPRCRTHSWRRWPGARRSS